ncbi:MAG: HAD-IIA family hydrolase [Chthonomonadales bacterium]
MCRSERQIIKSKLYVFDMDGVLFRMDDPLPHASETVRRLQLRGDKVWFLTNNSSKSRAEYVAKLAKFNIITDEEHIMTSAYGTSVWLAEHGRIGQSVFVVGEAGLENELTAAGMKIVPAGAEKCDIVVAGWDRQFSYSKLAAAHRLITEGALFIATNRDVTYPDAGGKTLPGGGSIVAAIETCSETAPITIGKPEVYTLNLILKMAQKTPEDTVVIGDRIDTDIAIGRRVSANTVLVLTGISTRRDAETSAADIKPEIIIDDLSYLT